MGKHKVNIDRNEVATGEDWGSLNEGIERVEGETCEWSYCLGAVVNDVYSFV